MAALLLFPMNLARAEKQDVTPYGDYCIEFSVYGICRGTFPTHQAMAALDNYYRQKGFRVVILGRRGRFIVADIYKSFKRVDKVIFDTNTGRLRSVY